MFSLLVSLEVGVLLVSLEVFELVGGTSGVVLLVDDVELVEEVEDVDEVEEVEEFPASESTGVVPTDSVPVAKEEAPPVDLAKATIP